MTASQVLMYTMLVHAQDHIYTKNHARAKSCAGPVPCDLMHVHTHCRASVNPWSQARTDGRAHAPMAAHASRA